jgi:hypothetical protein
MHKAVLQRLQDSQAHVLVTTGVLGLIPLEYQHEAPVYDSGLPNKERVEHTVRWYFTKFAKQYSAIIVYSDFYAEAIYKGIKETNLAYNTKYIFGHYTRDTYENLMKPENLDALEVAYKELL